MKVNAPEDYKYTGKKANKEQLRKTREFLKNENTKKSSKKKK